MSRTLFVNVYKTYNGVRYGQYCWSRKEAKRVRKLARQKAVYLIVVRRKERRNA